METLSLRPIIRLVTVIIAIPVFVVVPVAVFLDKKYGTLPLMTIGGLAISACVSAFSLMKALQK